MIKIIMIALPISIAISKFGTIAPMAIPKEELLNDTNKLIDKKFVKFGIMTDRKLVIGYTTRLNIEGNIIPVGSSARTLVAKYGLTPYNLLSIYLFTISFSFPNTFIVLINEVIAK